MSTPIITVFISYAWESDAFRSVIWDLGQWIQLNGKGRIKVITDHLYRNRPPEKGWNIWMQDQLLQSQVVLVVCTEKYIKRFNKQEVKGKGKGVTYEGAIITQQLINDQLLNDKFFPILPENGDLDHIPLVLQQYYNCHFFPIGNEGILKMILNDNPTYTSIDGIIDDEITCEEEKEQAVLEIHNSIKPEKEEKIPVIIPEMNNQNEIYEQSPLEETIRTFLFLSEFDKLKIAGSLGVSISQLNHDNVILRDKQIFRTINANGLIAPLWEAINRLSPMKPTQNPFSD